MRTEFHKDCTCRSDVKMPNRSQAITADPAPVAWQSIRVAPGTCLATMSARFGEFLRQRAPKPADAQKFRRTRTGDLNICGACAEYSAPGAVASATRKWRRRKEVP